MRVEVTTDSKKFYNAHLGHWLNNEASDGVLMRAAFAAKKGAQYFSVLDSNAQTVLTACLVPQDQL